MPDPTPQDHEAFIRGRMAGREDAAKALEGLVRSMRRPLPETVACPFTAVNWVCGAGVGEVCKNQYGGKMEPSPLPHTVRYTAADANAAAIRKGDADAR